MAQADLGWLRDLYDRYGAGDVAAVLDRLAPDVEWVSDRQSPALAAFSGAFHGPDGVRRYFESLNRDWRIERHDMQEMVADGDEVLVRNQVEATNRKTGKRVEVATQHRLRLRGGRIARFEEHFDETEVETACHGECPPAAIRLEDRVRS